MVALRIPVKSKVEGWKGGDTMKASRSLRRIGRFLLVSLFCLPVGAEEIQSYWVRAETQLHAGVGEVNVGAGARLIFEKMPFVSPYVGAELDLSFFESYFVGCVGIQRAIPLFGALSFVPAVGYSLGSNMVYFSCNEGLHGQGQIALGKRRFRFHVAGSVFRQWCPYPGFFFQGVGMGVSLGI